jgi:hypothetical protein
MKICTGAFIVLLLIAACKKGTGDSPGKGNLTFVISIHKSDPENHTFIIDSFVRDANNRLTKLVVTSIDSNFLPIAKNTGGYIFTYSGNDSLPISYTNYGANEFHTLKYDGRNRIIMDSSIAVTINFTYSSVGTIINMDFPPNGSAIDTVVLTNENITGLTEVYFAPTYTKHSFYSNTYSSLTNPIHFGGSMGFILLGISNEHNYLSKNLVSQSIYNSHLDFTATWSTDTSGRVISGVIETATIFGGKYNKSITFQYK